MDVALTVLVFLSTAATGFLGVYVTLHPPETDKQKGRHKVWFVLLAIVTAGLIGRQAYYNRVQQGALREQLNTIRANTDKLKEPIVVENPQDAEFRRLELDILGKLSQKRDTGVSVPLKMRVDSLADEIHTYLKGWENGGPRPPDPSDPNFNSKLDQYRQKYAGYLQNIRYNYDVSFGGRVTYCLEEMEAQGIHVRGSASMCLAPPNPTIMTMCADQLKAAAERLP